MADKGAIHETNLGILRVPKVADALEDPTLQNKIINDVKSDCWECVDLQNLLKAVKKHFINICKNI